MAIRIIEEWLNNPASYETGLKLYREHDGDELVLLMLEQGFTAYNKKRLTEALREISRSTPDVPVPSEQKAVRVIATTEELQKMPQEMRDLVERVKHLYKENGTRIGQLHAHKEKIKKLKAGDAELYTRENGLGILVNTVLDADDEIRELLDRIDAFKTTGKLPEPSAPVEMTYGETYDEIKRLRSQISKQQHNPKRAAEVAKWKERKKFLEKKIHELV